MKNKTNCISSNKCQHGEMRMVDDECETCGHVRGKKEEWKSFIIERYDADGIFIESRCQVCCKEIPVSDTQKALNTMMKQLSTMIYNTNAIKADAFIGLREELKKRNNNKDDRHKFFSKGNFRIKGFD